MNQLFLVGRIVRDPELKKVDGKCSCYLTVAVKRQYKNSDGIYESDFISCTVWNVIAERVCEFCKKGDLISVKAHIQNNNYVDKDENQVYSYDIIADQISFMQSQKSKDEENEEDNENEDDDDEELLNAE